MRVNVQVLINKFVYNKEVYKIAIERWRIGALRISEGVHTHANLAGRGGRFAKTKKWCPPVSQLDTRS